MSLNEEFISELKAMINDVKTIKTTVEKTDEKINNFTAEILQVKEENKQLKVEVTNLIKQNQQLVMKVNDLDQYSRIDNVIISGIPEEDNEDIINVVKETANKLEVNLMDHDISIAHRLKSTRGKIPPIIVRFTNRNKKIALIKNSKRLRLKPIYVNEQLTPYTMSLFKSARDLKEEGLIERVWTKDGKVFIMEEENGLSKRITTEDDLPSPTQEDNAEENQAHHVAGVSQQTQSEGVILRPRQTKTLTLSQLGNKNRNKRNKSKTGNRNK
ncbi:uncharacterized protein LOC135834015 [Planococcus citri]|uniref:uncharacterized protein LOC135834015 n=1 Tax=Planococcus citri TaxID=170843 RepID=UPI0031F80ED0